MDSLDTKVISKKGEQTRLELQKIHYNPLAGMLQPNLL